MDAKSTGAAGAISYDEFEPFCKWQREEVRDTLIIQLQEFKKEDLKVHVSNNRILKISGERKVDATKRSQFYKEVEVPKNCDTNGIQAKFAKSHLYITMPKKLNVAVPEQNNSQQIAGSNITTKPEAAKDQTTPPDQLSNRKDKMVPSPPPNGSASNSKAPVKVSKGKQLSKIAVSAGMLVAVLAALVAFVVYMFKSTLED